MDFIRTLIGLPGTLHSIGCYHSNNTKDLRGHGGNVFNATKYSIRLRFACVMIATRSLVIAGGVIQNDAPIVSRMRLSYTCKTLEVMRLLWNSSSEI